MQAVIYSSKGPAAEVLQLVERPRPNRRRAKCGCGSPTAASIRRTSSRAPAPPARSSAYAEVIPHSDGAGTIDAVGAGVDRAARRRAGLALQRAVGAARTAPLPSRWCCRRRRRCALPDGVALGGRRVDRHSADDRLPCGGLLRQPARAARCWSPAVPARSAPMRCSWRGAPAPTSSPASATTTRPRIARAARRRRAIDYRREDLAARGASTMTAGQGVDALIDVDASSHAPIYGGLLAEGGQAVVYGSNAPQFENAVRADDPRRGLGLFLHRLQAARCGVARDHGRRQPAARPTVRLQHPPTAIFALDEAVAAHQRVERGANAKVLLKLRTQAKRRGRRSAAL